MEEKEEYTKFLEGLSVYEVRNIARSRGILYAGNMRKRDVITLILTTEPKEIEKNKGRPHKGFIISKKSLNIAGKFDELEAINKKKEQLIEDFLRILVDALYSKDKDYILNFLNEKLNKILEK